MRTDLFCIAGQVWYLHLTPQRFGMEVTCMALISSIFHCCGNTPTFTAIVEVVGGGCYHSSGKTLGNVYTFKLKLSENMTLSVECPACPKSLLHVP